VTYFSGAANASDEIRSKEARFFSRSGNYALRAFTEAASRWRRIAATSANSSTPTMSIGPLRRARRDESRGQWQPAQRRRLVRLLDGAEGSSGSGNGHFDAITRNVWRYFTDYCLHWLDQTGCVAGTSAADQVWKGIDGCARTWAGAAAAGLGVHRQRHALTEMDVRLHGRSLDGGAVTYRRRGTSTFLNENILFDMKALNVGSNSMTSGFRNLLEQRRTDYGQALVLLNTTSHDEQNYNDPWQALLRYAVCATIDGAPMIFTGRNRDSRISTATI
jgi:hypothetical protein